MKMTHPIPIDLLRRLIRYEPETGDLYWLPRTPDLFNASQKTPEHACAVFNSGFAGQKALNQMRPDGYRVGEIFSKPYRAHRVAFALHHGRWPEHTIDHINGDRADNRAANLRDVPRVINARNMGWKNASKMRGVHRAKDSHSWHAKIGSGRRCEYLGSFPTAEEAMAARRAAEAKYGYHENHGRSL